MNNFKEKSQVFIIGLLVGLIVAGSFFVLKLDDYFKELNLYKSISNTFSSDHKTDQPTQAKSEAADEKEKGGTSKIPAKKTILKPGEAKELVNTDTLAALTVKDSVLNKIAGTDDIVVRKDELLSTKTMEVICLDPIAKANSKDSLLQKVSGIKDDRSSVQQFLNIEFWASPLNYKGYRMSKYKLIVYGITSEDGLKLFRLDDVVYAKISGMVYRLDYSSDFKPYERITDDLIINKLK